MNLPNNLDNILAVQAMFPVTSGAEMAGQADENPIADAAAVGPVGVWPLLADRLQAIPEYVDLFINAFDDIYYAEDITYGHAANAIAAFEIDAWRADNSPWDAYQAGNYKALTLKEHRGRKLFFGSARSHRGDAEPKAWYYYSPSASPPFLIMALHPQ